ILRVNRASQFSSHRLKICKLVRQKGISYLKVESYVVCVGKRIGTEWFVCRDASYRLTKLYRKFGANGSKSRWIVPPAVPKTFSGNRLRISPEFGLGS